MMSESEVKSARLDAHVPWQRVLSHQRPCRQHCKQANLTPTHGGNALLLYMCGRADCKQLRAPDMVAVSQQSSLEAHPGV